MLGPVRHVAELARATATRGSRRRDDAAALAELETRAVELSPGLDLEWLGVSGYRFTYEGQTLFIDPYFSRVPLSSLLLRRPATPDPAALDRFLNAPGE